MKETIFSSAYFGVVISISAYALGFFVKRKLKAGFLNPLVVAVVVVITFLLAAGVSYESYNVGGKYISYLLTPATVCLAIPLYQQLALLKKYKKAVVIGILAGVLSSLGSVLALSYLFGLSHEQYVTLLPKSITMAIGIGVSNELGGIQAITVASIAVTGILGNMLGPAVCRLFKIREPIAAGLALGTASHAFGTVKALEMGEVQGAMGSLSIVVAGLITVVGASFFAYLL
ncbi:MAG: LrgB family protein [Christensenellales bacterium]|jgi:predicted murein hydrolase (TIGR00659 family)